MIGKIKKTLWEKIRIGVAGGLTGLVLGALPLNADNIKLEQNDNFNKNVKNTVEDRGSIQEFLENLKQFEVYDAGKYETKPGNFYIDRIPNYYEAVPKLRRLRENISKRDLSEKLLDSVEQAYNKKYFSTPESTRRTWDSWKIENNNYLLQSRIFRRVSESGNSVGDLGLVVIRQSQYKDSEKREKENGKSSEQDIEVYTLLPLPKYRGDTVLDAFANKKGQIFVTEIGGPKTMLGDSIAVFNPEKDGSYNSFPGGYVDLDKKFEPDEAGAVRVYGSEHKQKHPQYIDGILLRKKTLAASLGKIRRNYYLLGTEQDNGKLPLYRLEQQEKEKQSKKYQDKQAQKEDNKNKSEGVYEPPW